MKHSDYVINKHGDFFKLYCESAREQVEKIKAKFEKLGITDWRDDFDMNIVMPAGSTVEYDIIGRELHERLYDVFTVCGVKSSAYFEWDIGCGLVCFCDYERFSCTIEPLPQPKPKIPFFQRIKNLFK